MYIDFMTQAAVIAWGIVAIAGLLNLFSRKCGSVVECCSLALISLMSFTKSVGYLRGTLDIDGPALGLGVVLAIYFIVRADTSWTRHGVSNESCKSDRP